MKRRKLIDHLTANGCILAREGAKHSVFYNPVSRRTSTVPRHTEVNDYLAKKICHDLQVKEP